MKTTRTIALVLALLMTLIVVTGLTVFAQDQPTQPASKPPTIAWKENDPNCDLIVVEGAKYWIIKHNGLYIAAEFVDNGSFYVAAVYVANDSNNRILVDPKLSFLALWRDVKKEPYEIVKPTEPEKIARKIESRARWANALRSFGAGMATTTRTTNTTESGSVMATGTGGSAIGTYSGSGSSTTTAPDREAQRRAERENAETSARAQGKAAGVMSAALKANTLFPKEHVDGEIYFQKKKFEAGFFVFKIGDAYYQFTVAPARK